jgi:hypothetical protein
MASIVFAKYAATAREFVESTKRLEAVLAKVNKKLPQTPLEEIAEEVMYRCRIGDATVTDVSSQQDTATHTTTITVKFRMSSPVFQQGRSQAGMNFRLSPPRTPMDINVPMPLPHRQSEEVIIGYRDFVWKPEAKRLASRNGYEWSPYYPLEAVCHKKKRHDSPHEDCECGIYAFASPDHRELDSNAWVWGEIAMWGDVLICESGYRAEFAYPQTLFMKYDGLKITQRTRFWIENAYGVPVHLVNHRAGQTASQIFQAEIDNYLSSPIDFTRIVKSDNPRKWDIDF